MALREAVGNAVVHGNKRDESKEVTIVFTSSPGVLEIEITDQGQGFDPQSVPDPTEGENVMKSSGRGIFFMRTFMDEVSWTQGPDGGTTVRLVNIPDLTREFFKESLKNGRTKHEGAAGWRCHRAGHGWQNHDRRWQRGTAQRRKGACWKKEKKKVLLNLAGVGYIDSSGIGELVSSYTSINNANGQLKLPEPDAKAPGPVNYHQTSYGF